MKSFLYVFMVLILIFFTACGGGASGDNSNENNNQLTTQGDKPANVSPDKEKEQIDTTTPKKISMVIGKVYTIHKGQTIIKESETAQIHLETEYKTGKTTALLLKGKARIEN